MKVHDSGPKAARDRQFLMTSYQSMIGAWKVKRLPNEVLAKMPNSQFNRMLEDIYNSKPQRELYWLNQYTGVSPRNGFKFRWFLFDLFEAKKDPIKNLDQGRFRKTPLVKAAENA